MAKSAGDPTVEAAVAGDRDALERLFRSRYDALHARLEPKIPSRFRGVLDADDVLQQTFSQAFRDIRHLHPPSEDAFDRWLGRIAEHRLIDSMKSLRRKKRGGDIHRVDARVGKSGSLLELWDELAADDPSVSGIVAREEAAQALRECIEDLPEQYAHVIRLRYLEDQSDDEVAQSLGASPAAVRGLCHRAKKRLRQAMGGSSIWFFKK